MPISSDSAAAARAELDAVAPLVNAWLIERGNTMDGASYVAALQLAAHVARSITTTPANRAAAAARDTLEALGYTYLDGAMHWKPPRGRRPAWLDDDAPPRRYPAKLTPELQHVLGRPNSWCAQYARVMRACDARRRRRDRMPGRDRAGLRAALARQARAGSRRELGNRGRRPDRRHAGDRARRTLDERRRFLSIALSFPPPQARHIAHHHYPTSTS
ncbi:hypothetical protein [Burkholderia glumae]|uniref:hypothetical protein n=1 Tax=Burkholderia glumae TaxID=337 RepID=UPI0002DFEBDC|nr:hypothetical protein [Burkholderia glumae]QHE11829.1 hypothetical protein GQR88_16410 [Burkholderia glumae AU6208]